MLPYMAENGRERERGGENRTEERKRNGEEKGKERDFAGVIK